MTVQSAATGTTAAARAVQTSARKFKRLVFKLRSAEMLANAGEARFITLISDEVDLDIYQAMATRAGGEPIMPPN